MDPTSQAKSLISYAVHDIHPHDQQFEELVVHQMDHIPIFGN